MKQLIEQKIANGESFVLKFSASWCAPCKNINKILTEDILVDNIVSVDIDEHFEIAQEYGVRAVPTLIKFENGQKVSVKTGSQTKSDLQNFLFG